MTITVIPDPTNSPPRNAVTVAVAAGSVMSEVSVWRNDPSGRSLLRTQPSAGFDSRTVYDYECPYGVPVTYDWTASYSAVVSEWTETWASTAAWTASLGTWGVSGGKARNTSGSGAFLYRNMTAVLHRITLAGFTGDGFMALQDNVGNSLFTMARNGSILTISSTASGSVATTIDSTLPMTIDMTSTSYVVTGTGGTFARARTDVPQRVMFGTAAAALAFNVDDVGVYTYASGIAIAETSSSVTLDSADTWLVHPASPGKSFRLSNTDGSKAGIREIADVVNATSSTAHAILGTSRPITTTSGPRGDDVTAMTIFLATVADQVAMRSLLADDVPILIQMPAAWANGFACGYYQVGDVSTSRLGPPRAGFPYRDVQLPLQRVQSPIVAVVNSGWSYAALAVDFVKYSDLPLSFATYADLASNTRS